MYICIKFRLHNMDLLWVSPEQRLIMRNIPFFVLPSHMATPHVGARIDCHNSRYVNTILYDVQAHVTRNIIIVELTLDSREISITRYYLNVNPFSFEVCDLTGICS